MSRVRIVQSLVVSSWLLYLIWGLLPADLLVTDTPAIRLLKADGYGAILNSQNVELTIGVFFLWTLAAIGLLLFKNWGRHLYLGLTLWSLIGAALFGIHIASPLDALLETVINLLDGGILAVAYLSPTRELFSTGEKEPASS